MGFLNPLYHAVAWLLVHIHAVVAHVVGESAGWSVAIVLLTVGMRLVLVPVFVKQIRSQRAMQALQPKMTELKNKYKNDKEKLNAEMMALWREAGVNPFSGCLPILLQIPIFIALFHTLNEIKPIKATCNTHLVSCFPGDIAGFPQKDIFSAAHAKLFGIAPIPASFKTAQDTLLALGGHQGSTRAICLILTIIMGATTFITQRQMMARQGAIGNDAQAQTQKILLYVFPIFFLGYGFYFPVGVLLYWLTTNLWSMGQQYLILHRMDNAPAPVVATPSGPPPGARPSSRPRGAPPKPAPKPASEQGTPAKPSRSTADVVLPPGGSIEGLIPAAPRPAPAKRPANRSNKKKKRRGR
jgi:YidC/Oxa1 family membrane protein insertase